MPKLEEALEGLNIKAADVLAWHEYPDRVVVVLISGPKLTWPPAVEPTGAPAPEVKASDEARQAPGGFAEEITPSGNTSHFDMGSTLLCVTRTGTP